MNWFRLLDRLLFRLGFDLGLKVAESRELTDGHIRTVVETWKEAA